MEKRLKNIFANASIDSDGIHVDGKSKKMPKGELGL